MTSAGNPLAPGRAASPLHARRCVRHANREAVARCPSCSGFFCRECVVDHAGRLMCADCLARESTAKKSDAPRRLAVLGRLGMAGAGVLVTWILFYSLGSLLLRIPPDFHEGTVWKDMLPEMEPEE